MAELVVAHTSIVVEKLVIQLKKSGNPVICCYIRFPSVSFL